MIERYALSPMKDLWSEEAKFDSWLEVELAVCDYWASVGRIPAEDLETIHQRAKIDVPRIEAIEEEVRHDVIAFTTQLAEKIGPSSRFVHMGLTSSDVVDTALALRVKRAGALILNGLERVHAVLSNLAVKHAYTVMMGRTHGMHAEPTTMGLKALVWREEFGRHLHRMREAIEEMNVGKISGAVGTCAHTGIELEEAVMAELGLKAAPVSTQVLQRDRHAHFMTTLALIGASIEKIATEIRNLQRPEVRELEEPFRKGQKGSSAMPHKRNPVQCEQLTGLARVLRGNAIPAMENVALWSERDISHSSTERVVLADSCILADYMLHKIAGILERLTVNEERMRANLNVTRGLIFSQKMLLYLVDQGLTREDAYAAVQGAAMRTWHGGEDFAGELLKEAAVAERLTREDLEKAFDVQPYLGQVKAIFRRCGIELE
ncbi:MAG: adenylosuccinate lyase [Candidatus Sumerlaeota bacterium]|nr:adenylosuccinate lyase [Candidatus Sumerlaeota bacterium]